MRKIIWVKWHDPLATFMLKNNHVNDEDDEIEYQSSKDTFNENEDEEDENTFIKDKDLKPKNSLGPAILSPMGIIPVNEYNAPGKLFNFWIGHTNFDIDSFTKDLIARTPGVETLDIFTRYRFRLGIGKGFKENEVKESIEKMLCPSEKSKTSLLSEHLATKYKYWGIYEDDKKHIIPCGGDSIEKVKKCGENKKEILVSWK